MKVRIMVIVFHKGKRIVKDFTEQPRAGQEYVKKLKKVGAKAHLVTYNRPFWPPEEDDMHLAGEGMIWCPYCRAWRWYGRPKYRDNAELMSDPWFMNIFHAQEIKVCLWCWTSEQDWYVRQMNGLWDTIGSKKRSRRRRR